MTRRKKTAVKRASVIRPRQPASAGLGWFRGWGHRRDRGRSPVEAKLGTEPDRTSNESVQCVEVRVTLQKARRVRDLGITSSDRTSTERTQRFVAAKPLDTVDQCRAQVLEQDDCPLLHTRSSEAKQLGEINLSHTCRIDKGWLVITCCYREERVALLLGYCELTLLVRLDGRVSSEWHR